jgi:hypothetical protein
VKGLKKPELKLSGAKPPQVLADFYYDLRDRRLLPLVALVVVAIAAVPFLLGSDEEEVALPPPGGGVAETLKELGDGSTELTVVEAEPGLRDYRKRLEGRTPSNPFQQKYSGPVGLEKAKLGGGEGEGGGGSSGSGGGGETSVTVEGGGEKVTVTETTEPGGTPPRSRPPQDPGLVFFDWAIDVRIEKKGGKRAAAGSSAEPIVRKRVLPQTALPGDKASVVTYLGAARKGKKLTGKALMIVSDKVRSVAGDARCVAGDGVCQLLEVEPGFPVVLTYGENEVRYSIKVLKLDLVIIGRGRAPGR